jgi:photosystem II stability/assembly factor-like uncharacterized protein
MSQLLRCFVVALTLTAGIAMSAASASASQYSPSLYGGMHWRMIGPFRGGRTLTATGVPGNPTLFYFGAVAGGVWKTNDAGRTWYPIFDGQNIASIGAVAVAPSDPNIIYVGTGEADMRTNITYGNGVYKSSDAGRTWTHIGLEDTRQIGRIAVDPTDPNRVFVAALGHAYGPNEQRGVFRSLDGGRTWQRVLYRDANTGAIDLILDPQDLQTVYAALWQTRRPPWNIYPPAKGPGSGLYVSHDGGSTWTQVSGNGFPSKGLGRMGVGIAPSDHRRVYVIADAAKGGLYRSDDGGATWVLENGEQRLWGRGWYFCSLAVDSKNPDTVYVSDTALYRSTDGGRHFTPIKGSPDGDDFHQPWIDPTDPQRIIVASDQGASVSINGGATWSSWFNQPTAQFYHIIADDQFPFRVYGAQQDSGAAMTPMETGRNGITGQDWQPIVAGGESGYVAPDPRNPDVVYGDTVTKQTLSNGQEQNIDPTIRHPGRYRSVWTLPLVFSRVDPRVLYFARQVLFRSADGGDSWQIISPDLSRANPGVPRNVDAVTAADNEGGPRRGVIYAIAPSPIRKGEIWCGTDDGKIWITLDEGAHWRDITPPQLSAWSKVGIIEASAFDANSAFAAVDRHRLDDLHPYIYRTRDGGKTWTSVSSGIPVGAYVNAVREDPSRRGLLYAGTELGVYVSFDAGDHWQSLRLNMPVVPVRDLVVKQDSLAVATHGRSFWVLDDLSPLHQLAANILSSPAWLFVPETAVRVRPHSDPGERLPPEEPSGENRPAGAFIDYVVKTETQGPLTLSIEDAAGHVVRRYSSADHPKPADPEKLDFPTFWAPVQPSLDSTAGMHRFLWDFQYAAPAGAAQSDFGGFGPFAAPGRYTVRLAADGKTWTAPLMLVRDPRVKATDADLVAQFSLARKIEAAIVTAAQGRARAIALRRAALAGGPSQVPELTSFYAAGNALGQLETLVESADTAPTSDEYAAFAHWQAVLSTDLKEL